MHVDVALFSLVTKPLPPKQGYQVLLTADEIKAHGFEGFFVDCGRSHFKGHEAAPQTVQEQPEVGLPVGHRPCVPTNPRIYAALKSWGILDNVKGEKRVAVSFLDKMTALHDDFLALAEFNESAGHKERTAPGGAKTSACPPDR